MLFLAASIVFSMPEVIAITLWRKLTLSPSSLRPPLLPTGSPTPSAQPDILNVITRVNSYTGVKYSNDPTILAWETGAHFSFPAPHRVKLIAGLDRHVGNELGAYKLSEGAPPLAWTKNIATYIKSLAPNHLVIDGSDGFIDQKGVAAPGVLVDKVDIMSDHAYPRDIALVTSEIAVAKKYNKGFLIGGEFALSDRSRRAHG